MVEHRITRRRRRSYLVAGLFLVLPVVGVGCRGNDGDAVGNESTTTRPVESSFPTSITGSTTSVPPEEVVVRSAFEAASRSFNEAAAIPDPGYPALAATHTGPMLEQRRDVLLALKADGRVIRYPPDSKYTIVVRSVALEDGAARLRFCAVDDGERVVASTGEVVAGGVVTVEGRAALRRDGDTWKLAEQQFDSRDPGRASC